jgi:hypothetical protein
MPTAGPKRTRTQREADLAETARLDRMGFTQREIAERIGVSSVQICFDLQKLRKRYVEMANVHAGERIGELLQSYRDVRQQALLAWEKSWQDAERVTVTVRPSSGDGLFADVVTTTTTIREGRLPGAQYLQVILDTYAAERKLLCLDQEQPAVFLTADAVVTLANTIMAAIGRHVHDPQLVQQMKMDVLQMMEASVPGAATATINAVPPTGDGEPTTVEQDADEPADPPADPPAADEPMPARVTTLTGINGINCVNGVNGAHGGGDEFLLEELEEPV